MGKSAEPTEVTPGKVRALAEALEREGSVTFKNGHSIKRLKGGGLQVTLRFGKQSIERTFGTTKLEDAYDYAVNWRHQERELPPRKPFWFDPDKRRPPRPEWEECPF